MPSKKYTAAVMIGLIIVAVLVVLLFFAVAPNIERQRAEQNHRVGVVEGGTTSSLNLGIAFAEVYGALILLGIGLPAGLTFLFDF